jgi:hypothetical protein
MYVILTVLAIIFKLKLLQEINGKTLEEMGGFGLECLGFFVFLVITNLKMNTTRKRRYTLPCFQNLTN